MQWQKGVASLETGLLVLLRDVWIFGQTTDFSLTFLLPLNSRGPSITAPDTLLINQKFSVPVCKKQQAVVRINFVTMPAATKGKMCSLMFFARHESHSCTSAVSQVPNINRQCRLGKVLVVEMFQHLFKHLYPWRSEKDLFWVAERCSKLGQALAVGWMARQKHSHCFLSCYFLKPCLDGISFT